MINAVSLLPIRPERLQKLKTETKRDTSLQELMRTVLDGWPEDKSVLPLSITPYFSFKDELTVQDGLIFKGDRVLVPQSLRREMMQAIHATHSGIEGCLKRSCRLPPQRGAEQGHLEVAGVGQDGDARQEVDRTRGVWVCRPAGGDPQLALWHLLVVECKKYDWQNMGRQTPSRQ